MKRLDLYALSDEARDLVRECELRGERTVFERDGRPVAILASWDEYLALRETLAIVNEPLFYARLETADEEMRQGKMILVEDLGQ